MIFKLFKRKQKTLDGLLQLLFGEDTNIKGYFRNHKTGNGFSVITTNHKQITIPEIDRMGLIITLLEEHKLLEMRVKALEGLAESEDILQQFHEREDLTTADASVFTSSLSIPFQRKKKKVVEKEITKRKVVSKKTKKTNARKQKKS